LDPGLDDVKGDLEGFKKVAWRIDDGGERDKVNRTRASCEKIRKTENAGA